MRNRESPVPIGVLVKIDRAWAKREGSDAPLDNVFEVMAYDYPRHTLALKSIDGQYEDVRVAPNWVVQVDGDGYCLPYCDVTKALNPRRFYWACPKCGKDISTQYAILHALEVSK